MRMHPSSIDWIYTTPGGQRVRCPLFTSHPHADLFVKDDTSVVGEA